MLKITICAVGTNKEKYMRDAVDDYVKRLSRKYKVEIIECRECATVAEEGEYLLKALPKDAFVVALDLGGKEFDSVGFAGLLDEKMTGGVSHFAFAIGGSDGLSRAVADRADLRMSLSKLTFTHLMARLILLEQLYRAMKINSGETYHK